MTTYARTTLTRVFTISIMVLLTATAATAQPWPWSPAQKMDLQGDIMLLVPAVKPNCGPNNTAPDPVTGINCIANGVEAHGIENGWVFTPGVLWYTAAQRQQIYQAAQTAHYTHFIIDVSDCSYHPQASGGFYEYVFPDCNTLPAKYGVGTYGEVLNTVLHEMMAAPWKLIPICAGTGVTTNGTPTNLPSSTLNKALCPVAMNDWDGDFTSNNAECRIMAVSDQFPNARVYYELPYLPGAPVPTATGSCQPVSGLVPVNPSNGDPWIQQIRTRYPQFAGVMYETRRVLQPGDPTTTQYLNAAHSFWRSAQEVLFETDTHDKTWDMDGASPYYDDNNERTYNANLLAASPQLHGYMSGSSTTHPALKTHVLSDYNGDGKTDLTVYRASTNTWYGAYPAPSFTAGFGAVYGTTGDVLLPGADYDGDGKSDLALYRPSSLTWYVAYTGSGFTNGLGIAYGISGDIVLPGGDYDGDGRADLSVYRPSTGIWYVLYSKTNYTTGDGFTYGAPGDIPLGGGDYDGDGKSDLAVYRPSNHTWYAAFSGTAFTTGLAVSYGNSGDTLLPNGDYDGDGRADLAVYRPSNHTWYVAYSGTSYASGLGIVYGTTGDTLLPNSDYDGDGRSDLAVYRPSDNTWHAALSGSSYTVGWDVSYGVPGDVPAWLTVPSVP